MNLISLLAKSTMHVKNALHVCGKSMSCIYFETIMLRLILTLQNNMLM